MNTHADKIQKKESHSAANTVSQQQGGDASTFQTVDDRAEAVQMRNLREMANDNPRVRQLKAFQEMANDNPQAKHVAQLQLADKSQPIQRVVRIGKSKLKTRRNISQLWRADEMDEHLGLESDEKKRFQSELLLLAEGKNITEFPGWDEAYQRLRGSKIFIKADDGVVSIIKNTTDLMVWLGSYPLESGEQPRGYAETKILQRALGLLERVRKTITNKKVWDAVKIAAQMEPDDDDDDETGDKWGDLELVDSVDMMGRPDPMNQLPGRYRRKLPPGEYEKKLEELRGSLSGYTLVGLHATTMENTGPLVREGVSPARFNTGHGVGKGNGFYIIPAQNITAGILRKAKAWGNHVVAVYLPESAEQEWAAEGDNVQTLEEENEENTPRYYMFGDLEAVIPPSLCPEVKLVVDPADISMGNTEYEAERYDDDFGFMDSL